MAESSGGAGRTCRERRRPAVDVLVNNAAMRRPAPALETAQQDWHDTLSVNLNSVFAPTRVVAADMVQRGWGRIVNISSVLGLLGDSHAASYSSSKAALIGLTRFLAVDGPLRGDRERGVPRLDRHGHGGLPHRSDPLGRRRVGGRLVTSG